MIVTSSSKHPLRPIRSYVRREGRITRLQALATETLWPLFGLSANAPGLLDMQETFGRTADTILEIGFGDGQALLEIARNNPEQNFIGIEVYRTGVGNLLGSMAKQAVSNIRIFCADAVEILENKIPEAFLTKVQIFFADPWPKTKHHKRRLIQPFFIALIVRKLRVGGTLHLVTDWEDYAKQMLEVVSENIAFQNVAGIGQFAPRSSERPVTKYEQRALRLGHPIWELIFKRIV